jgi:hypothetical protein
MIRIEFDGREIPNPQDFNKLLQTRYTSIFEIGEKYFDLPNVEDMIKKIENSYDMKKRKSIEKQIEDCYPKHVVIHHDVKTDAETLEVEFGDGTISVNKI